MSAELEKSGESKRPAMARRLKLAVVLGAGLALSGCVVYPSSPYGGGYYAAPAVYAAPVVVGGGWGWGWHGGCCWGGWRGGWR